MYAGSTPVACAARTTVSASQRGTRICSKTSTSFGFPSASDGGVWACPDTPINTRQSAAVVATAERADRLEISRKGITVYLPPGPTSCSWLVDHRFELQSEPTIL